MGDYANWEDVTGRFPSVHKISDAVEMSDSYITGIEAIMNSYLAKVFTTPISDKPPLLTDICVDLVYSKIAVNKDKASGKVKDAAIELLKSIINSEVILLDSSGVAIDVLGHAVWGSQEDYHYSFSMLDPIENLIDPDLLDDEASDRS